MNFRFKLPTSGLLTSGLLTGIALATVTASTAMVGCSREELAPWFPQDLRIDCQEAPQATVGQPFEWDLNPTGGVEPLTWLTDVLECMVAGRTKANELARLLPWTWQAERLAAAAVDAGL